MRLADRLRDQLELTQDHPVPFESDMRQPLASSGIAAAVLIAVTDRAAPGIILTKRPETMRRHAGQVAFPGGRADPDDADPVATALREAREEIGLPPEVATIVGTLATYRTVTGFDIVPVLAVIPPDLPLVADAREVETIFEVPLTFLVARPNWASRTVEFNGLPRSYIEGYWGDQRIWGATAAMIANLTARLA